MEHLLNHALDMLKSGAGLMIATADRSGIPHMASAGQADMTPDGRIAVTEWFCPRTLENLLENRNISILIYDPSTREGFQIVGSLDGMNEVAVMDGFMPGKETEFPQVERELVVRIDAVLDYTHGPHTDRPRDER